MIIKLCDIGQSLGTRPLGNHVRENVIIPNLKFANDVRIVFDFQNIDVVSHSFADECFGKLVEKLGLEFVKERTTFRNANPFVASVIKSAINKRIIQTKELVCN